MEQIRELRYEDIEQIAQLHQISGMGNGLVDPEVNGRYYQEVFLNSPWRSSEMPSLVCCTKKGDIVGFIGVLTRRMRYRSSPLCVAVAHRLMVDSRRASPFAAVRLLKHFLSGPQDLSISDGANDQGKTFWLGCGGSISWLHSIDWFKPLCPASYSLTLASRKWMKNIRFFLPLGRLMDLAFGCMIRRKQTPGESGLRMEKMTPEGLLDCICRCAEAKSLRPDYSLTEIRWLYQFLQQNLCRGRLDGFLLKNGKEEIQGGGLYYLKKDKTAEVLLLCGRPHNQNRVYNTLMDCLHRQKAIGVMGRMLPDFLPAFGEERVLLKRGCWALIASRKSELLNTIQSGDAFLSALEGELCLYAPDQYL